MLHAWFIDQRRRTMANRNDSMTIEGTVRSDSLDASQPCHRICIVATDGHTFEVEPSYVGRYLEKFEGHHVVARVQAVPNGKKGSVVRVQTLTVLDRTPFDAGSDSNARVRLLQPDGLELLSSTHEDEGSTSHEQSV
jgi:hypothetical protein